MHPTSTTISLCSSGGARYTRGHINPLRNKTSQIQ